MFYSKNPVFSEKSIVKAEVLQENVLYPMRMFEHLYADYTDGIVTGVRLQAKDTDELLLSPEITVAFARDMLQKQEKEEADISE